MTDNDRIDRDMQMIRNLLSDADNLELEAPPADLWATIEATVAAEKTSQPAPPHPEVNKADADTGGNVVTLAGGRARPERMLGRRLLAAAAVVLLGALVGVGLAQRDDADVITAVELSPEGLDPAGAGLSGSAELIDTGDGYDVKIDGVDLPALDDGFYELWIIDTSVEGMHSLGTVKADGTFNVPSGVDVANFPVVDISIELPDGDPTHSGTSVLRGVLDV